MSWWDSLVSGVENVGSKAINFAETNPVTQALVNNQLSQAILKPIAWEADQVSHLMSFTGIEGARLLSGDPRTLTSEGIHQAWDKSYSVSPGQALLANPLFQAPLFQAAVGHEGQSIYGGAPLTPGGAIDVTNDKVRAQAFESGGVGEVGSWGTDAVLQYYTNPLVVVGAVAKPAIAAARGTARISAAGIENTDQVRKVLGLGPLTRDQLPKFGKNTIEDEYSRLSYLGNKITAREKQAAGSPLSADETAAAAQKIRPGWEQGMADLYNRRADLPFVIDRLDRTIANRDAVAVGLSGARDYNEFMDTYMAARGDLYSLNRLKATATSVADMLENANNAKDYLRVARQTVPKRNPDGSYTDAWQSTTEMISEQKAIINDLIPRSNYFAKLLGTAPAQADISGSLARHAVVSPISPVNAFRDRLAVTKNAAWAGNDGFWTTREVAPLGGHGVKLRMATWVVGAAGHAPRGWLAVNGPAAANQADQIVDITRSAGMPTDVTQGWVDRYVRATTANQRAQTLADMEHDMTSRIVERNLGPNATKAEKDGAQAFADDFMRAYSERRGVAQREYRQRGNWMWDVESNSGTKIPLLDSMQSQYIPMMDFKLFERGIREHGMDEVARRWALRTDRAAFLAAGFSFMWKAGVLLRVGAIPRNVGESWLASWVFLGRFPGNPVTGTANLIRNRGQYDPARDVDGRQYLQRLQDKIDDLETARATNLDTMRRQVKLTRAEGAEGYYAQAHIHGEPLSHADVQLQIASPPAKGVRGVLNRAERDRYNELAQTLESGTVKRGQRAEFEALHAKAARRVLSERQGNVTVKGGQVVKPADLTAADLSPLIRGRRGYGSEYADVYSVPRYETRMKAAPKPRQVVDDATGAYIPTYGDFAAAEFPDFEEVFGTPAAMADLRDLQTSTARITAEIEQTRQAYVSAAQAVKTPARAMAGRGGVAEGAFRGPGAFAEGEVADLAQQNVGAQARNAQQITMMESRGFRARQFSRLMRVVNGSHKMYEPTDPAYFTASAEFANRMVRNSDLARRLLSTDDPEGTARWLQTTPAGRDVLRELNLSHATDETIRDWTHSAYDNLLGAYPNAALRRDILAGEVTEAQVRGYLAGRTDLVPVGARDFAPVNRSIRPGDWVGEGVDAAFVKAWSQPENVLARYPLYNALYTDEFRAGIRRYETQLLGMSEADANRFISEHVIPQARLYATSNTKRVIYSSEVRNNVAEKLRFVAPFLQVTGNRFYYYGSQLLENPDNMARLFIGWNAIPTDDQGRISVHLPGPVAKFFGLEAQPTVRMYKSSLNLISNSEPWWSPGSGPIITAPLAEVIRRNGNSPIGKYMDSVADKLGLLPGGYTGTNAWDQVLPTWARRVMAGNGQQGANSLAQIMTIEQWRYEHHLRDTRPTLAEVNERNDQLWAFRVLSGFLSPVQVTPTNDMVEHYTDIYRKYTQKYGRDADAKFLADYPDYYRVVLNYTTSKTNVAPTVSAAQREDKYGQVLDEVTNLGAPEMAGIVTNTPGDDGQFDPTAYDWELGRPLAPGSSTQIRESKSPQQAFEDRIKQQGWTEYRAAAKTRDSLLLAAKQAGGSGSLNANANLWIKTMYQMWVSKITQDTTIASPSGQTYSPWATDFAQHDDATYGKRAAALRVELGTAGALVPEVAAPAAKYLAMRTQIGGLLTSAKAAGGSSNIDNPDNLWIKAMWSGFRDTLAQENPTWGEIQNRLFINDDFSEVPGAVPVGPAGG